MGCEAGDGARELLKLKAFMRGCSLDGIQSNVWHVQVGLSRQ